MRAIARFASIAIVIVCLCVFSSATAFAKSFETSVAPDYDCIKVSWTKVSKAVTYKVFRVDCTSYIISSGNTPRMKDYKKVAVKRGKAARKYVDKRVKDHRYYSYVVKAYDKKGELIKTTFDKDSLSYACAGFGNPTLFNNGYGENYTNDTKHLHLYFQSDYAGVSPIGAICKIYRKAKGESKFTLIAKKSLNKVDTLEYTDKAVEPGKTYTYKAKLAKIVKGKTFYSHVSNKVTIPAVAFKARYNVKAVSPSIESTDGTPIEAIVQISNASRNNGITIVDKKALTYRYASKSNIDTSSDESVTEERLQFTHYSANCKTWKKIPSKGVKLPQSGKLYLKAAISNMDGTSGVLCFAGKQSDAAISSIAIEETGLVYKGPGIGYTYGELNLVSGKGYAYQEWD